MTTEEGGRRQATLVMATRGVAKEVVTKSVVTKGVVPKGRGAMTGRAISAGIGVSAGISVTGGLAPGGLAPRGLVPRGLAPGGLVMGAVARGGTVNQEKEMATGGGTRASAARHANLHLRHGEKSRNRSLVQTNADGAKTNIELR